jgi:hypothetical protein
MQVAAESSVGWGATIQSLSAFFRDQPIGLSLGKKLAIQSSLFLKQNFSIYPLALPAGEISCRPNKAVPGLRVKLLMYVGIDGMVYFDLFPG